MNEPDSPTYRAWRKLPDNAVGHALFSLAMCVKVPYFSSIMPQVVAMRPGYCEVRSPKWWGVHNHLGTFHAIAACNIAEVAMGMLAEATVPATHRWIPKSMKVDYLAKANTSLRGVAESKNTPDFANLEEGVEWVIPVSIYDADGIEVVHADITTWVTPKK
jgi:acyl-coenzyme A thioesterase PaaI-like protein